MATPANSKHCSRDDGRSRVGAQRHDGISSLIVACITCAGVLAGGLSLMPARPALVWNYSDSVPLGLYRLEDRAPDLGDLVAMRPDGDLAAVLASAGVLKPGRLLLKPLAAVAGDTVCRDGLAVTLNGIPGPYAHDAGARVRRLPEWSGCRRLTANELFLLSTHPDSFDSRYFGPVDASQMVGVALPLITFPPHTGDIR